MGTNGRAGTVIEQPTHVSASEGSGSGDTRKSVDAFLPWWQSASSL
jgi:hypothetical protein